MPQDIDEYLAMPENAHLHEKLAAEVGDAEALRVQNELEAARHIALKARANGARPVPASFARKARSWRLDPAPPAHAFRNWNRMQDWFENS